MHAKAGCSKVARKTTAEADLRYTDFYLSVVFELVLPTAHSFTRDRFSISSHCVLLAHIN